MRVFCDTSVLVAASVEVHVHHGLARAVLERIRDGDDIGHTSAHALAEMFSVLTRMPTTPKLQSQDVLAILERNILPHFVLAVPASEDHPQAIRFLAATGLGGGRIYDLLHVRLAGKIGVDRIYTFNDREWRILAPDLAPIIVAPPH